MSSLDVVSRTLNGVDHEPSTDSPQAAGAVERSGKVLLRPVDFDPFGQPDAAVLLPTTDAQRDLWFSTQQGDGAHCAHLQLYSLRFRGALRQEVLADALQAVVQRHQALRSSFSACGDRVRIAPSLKIGMPVIDLTNRPPAERDAELGQLEEREARTPFDLLNGPLLRATLLRTDVDEHVMLFTVHHIAADGWSMGVLFDELGTLYSSAVRGEQPALPEPDSFAAFAERVVAEADGEESTQVQAYWRSVFATPPAALALPTDRPRPQGRTYAGGRAGQPLDRALLDSLKQLGSRHGCTQAGTLLSAFMAFLHRLTGQADLVVGMPSAAQAMTGQTRLVGHCLNVLPLRHDVNGEASFTALLDAMRPRLLDAFDHTQVTLGQAVEWLRQPREPGRLPLTSVLFSQVDHETGVAFEGLEFECRSMPRAFEAFDLHLQVELVPEGADLRLAYNADLFDAATIGRRLEEFETLLRAMVAAPGAPLNSLPLLGAGERELLDQFNGTPEEASPAAARGAWVHERVAARALVDPDAPAVLFEGGVMTASELDTRANQLAVRLVEVGFGPGQLAAVCVQRSPSMVVTLLGVLKAGGAYVPLEPGGAPEQAGFILEDSEASVLVTEVALLAELPKHSARTVLLDDGPPPAEGDAEPPDIETTGEDLAQLIYSPGPTGKLHGVEGTHRALANLLACMEREPGLTPDDVFVAVAPLARAASALEIFLPLITGARLALAGRGVEDDGTLLMAHMARCNANVMHASPETWARLIKAGWAGDTGLRALSGGAPITAELVADLRPRCLELWNLYGTTETSICSSAGRLEAGAAVTIGRPIDNTQVHVLDANMQRVPIGVAGELCIGGAGVARGYRRRPGLTAERFVRDRFGVPSKARIFRTGDLGRYRGDGQLEWLGRLAQQAGPGASVRTPEEAGAPEPPLQPRDDLELELQCMWRRALGVQRVGVADDFFALGGHSLLVVRLLAEIENSFGVAPTVRQFLERPTLEHLAELLRGGPQGGSAAAQAQAHPGDALLIREASPGASRPPVFCICGTQLYLELAQQLHPDHPVFALYLEAGPSTPGSGESSVSPTVQAMAADYLAAVRRAQPEGPYFLAGAAMGGVLAYEMAQQLRADGQAVGLVALLDAPGTGGRRPSFVKRAFFYARQVRELGAEYVTRRIAAGVRGEAPVTLPDPVRSRVESAHAQRQRASRQRIFLDALGRYHAQPYDGRLELFLAAQRSEADALLGDPVRAWHSLAPGRLAVHTVPGGHADMLSASGVGQWAGALQASLDAVLEGRAAEG